MADYRAYILDDDGRISRAIAFVCPDDNAAETYAKQFVVVHDIELWQGSRRIASFEAELE
jgi:hypothetical protein